MAKQTAPALTVETLVHDEATRKNIPTAEYQSVMQKDERSPVRVAGGVHYCYPALEDVFRSMESAN
ncbi:MAG: hypothetical protein JSS47_04420 [Proteobacteria bacterium]|nr:hypothetical protein [Pseudomonadota bacterium]